jgi:hypothetical protein
MFMRKLLKPALVAAALLGAATAATTAANATDVDVYFGVGGPFGDEYDPDRHFLGDPRYYPRFNQRHRYRISCWQGKERVQWAGFRRVRVLDCDGARYSYKARRGGDSFIISVNSRSGRIVSVREIY